MDLSIEGVLAASGATHVLADARPTEVPLEVSAAGLVDPDLQPVLNVLASSQRASTKSLAQWALKQGLKIRLGETDGQLASYECFSGGGIGVLTISVDLFRSRWWEDTAAAAARELTLAQVYSEQGSCVCTTSAHLKAAQAQVYVLYDLGRLGLLPPEWQAVIDSDGQLFSELAPPLIQKEFPACENR